MFDTGRVEEDRGKGNRGKEDRSVEARGEGNRGVEARGEITGRIEVSGDWSISVVEGTTAFALVPLVMWKR